MNDKKADILRVAQAAKVSASTVSRFFNHPDLVKPKTRARIEEAVKQTGYIRNRAAQTIHGIRSGTIGLIVPTINHAIFSELVQSFSDLVDENGFTILLASHGYDLDREYVLARKMLEHRVDGLALIGLEHASETFRLIDRQKTPTVLLWNYDPGAAAPCIGSDNHEVGHMIGTHVAGLGHREVACMFPPLAGNDRAAYRYDGLCAGLEEKGALVRSGWTLESTYSVTAAKDMASGLLSGAHTPGALICGNDVLAWGALHAAQRLRVDVPADMTVTGIGDFKGSNAFEPALTTVRIPARQIGRKAGIAITQGIISPDVQIESEKVAPQLVCRTTSAAPRPVRI